MRRRKVYLSIDYVRSAEEAKSRCIKAMEFYTPYMVGRFERPRYSKVAENKFLVMYYYHIDKVVELSEELN